MKNKKMLKMLAACAMAGTMMLTGCGDEPSNNLVKDWTIQDAYVQAQTLGFTGTFDEFLNHLTNIGDVAVDVNGHLIITLGDGTVVDAGNVTGQKGDKGDKGDQGLQGEKGDKGDQGLQGEKGDKGDQGLQGEKGDKGDQGLQGEKGDKGDQGLQGEKGDKGDTGATGEKGEDGEKGDQGDKGDKGDKGDQGEVGRVGFIVSSIEQLEIAVKIPNSYVVLASDITTTKEITINADQDLDFVLDLNGHTITNTSIVGALVGMRTYYNNAQQDYTINAVIKNGVITTTANSYYGIMANGNNINVTLENMDFSAYYGGLYTNGNGKGGEMCATDCTFTALATTGVNGLGAYLAANYEYTFENTEFTGADGIYAKSGAHVYTGCTITGNGTAREFVYNGNGALNTGAGLAIDSCDGYSNIPPMTFEINDCTITSVNGYGINEGVTAKAGNTPHNYLEELNIDAETVVTGAMGDIRREKTCYVSTVEQIIASANVDGAYIVLTNDIESEKEVLINATKDLDFTLDLNEHSIVVNATEEIGGAVDIRTYVSGVGQTTYTINAVVKNGTLTSNEVAAAYGAMAKGDNITFTLENVTASGYWGGFYTNGNGQVGTMNIINSRMIGLGTDGVGAYLAANYNYNFTNTEFTGVDGITTKSGTHVYNGCTLNGTGEARDIVYNGNGADMTGAGLVIVSCDGYSSTPPMTFEINDCTITSANGYGLVEGAIANAGKTPYSYLTKLDIDADTVVTGKLGDMDIETVLEA